MPRLLSVTSAVVDELGGVVFWPEMRKLLPVNAVTVVGASATMAASSGLTSIIVRVTATVSVLVGLLW